VDAEPEDAESEDAEREDDPRWNYLFPVVILAIGIFQLFVAESRPTGLVSIGVAIFTAGVAYFTRLNRATASDSSMRSETDPESIRRAE
jgi:hypothetical protein